MLILGCDPSGSVDPDKRNSGFCVLDLTGAPIVLARVDCGIDDIESTTSALIVAWRPVLVGIDQPKEVFLHGKAASTKQAHIRIVRDVIATARAGGRIGGVAVAMGVRVIEGTAADWRRAIVGSEKAENDATADAIRRRIPTWDAFKGANNNHTRDAGCVALWAAIRSRLAKRAA